MKKIELARIGRICRNLIRWVSVSRKTAIGEHEPPLVDWNLPFGIFRFIWIHLGSMEETGRGGYGDAQSGGGEAKIGISSRYAKHGKWLRIGCKTRQDTRNHSIFDYMISVSYDSPSNPLFGTIIKSSS